MKIILDPITLLRQGKIDRAEYDKLRQLAAESPNTLALTLLIAGGAVAVAYANLMLIPSGSLAIVMALLITVVGLVLLHKAPVQWKLTADICVLTGALTAASGIVICTDAAYYGFLIGAVMLAVIGILGRSHILVGLTLLWLTGGIGTFVFFDRMGDLIFLDLAVIVIVLYGVLAWGLYRLSKRVPRSYTGLTITASRISLLLVNVGFYIGSQPAYSTRELSFQYYSAGFAIAWAAGLVATGIWAWKQNRQVVMNMVIVFAGVNFHSQWSESMRNAPLPLLTFGLLLIGVVFGLQRMKIKRKAKD